MKSLLLDLILPRRCLGCRKFLSDTEPSHVCDPCLQGIRFTESLACAYCGMPSKDGMTCPKCLGYLNQLLVTASYEDPLVADMVKVLKYRFVRPLGESIGLLMTRFLKGNGLDLRPFCLVPVPLHWSRLNWRGFNQAEEMAQTISRQTGLPLHPGLLARTAKKTPQADLEHRSERIRNMQNVFACAHPEAARNQEILLVDDLSTTGSTLNDCARALKESGAKRVVGFVFARNQ